LPLPPMSNQQNCLTQPFAEIPLAKNLVIPLILYQTMGGDGWEDN
jgi:hypothetical protein